MGAPEGRFALARPRAPPTSARNGHRVSVLPPHEPVASWLFARRAQALAGYRLGREQASLAEAKRHKKERKDLQLGGPWWRK